MWTSESFSKMHHAKRAHDHTAPKAQHNNMNPTFSELRSLNDTEESIVPVKANKGTLGVIR